MGDAAAFFDVDGTLVRSNIAHYYIFLRLKQLPRGSRAFWLSWFYMRGPWYLYMDRCSREAFNRLFYRNYRYKRVEDLRALAGECFEQVMKPNLAQEACDVVRMHRRAGRRIVLVTGSLDFLMEPLAEYLGADHLEAVELQTWRGIFTGRLLGPILGGEEKRRRIVAYANETGVDLERSYAYGDSIADRQMLEAVGHPVAVNPDRRLARLARQRGWMVEAWRTRGSTMADAV